MSIQGDFQKSTDYRNAKVLGSCMYICKVMHEKGVTEEEFLKFMLSTFRVVKEPKNNDEFIDLCLDKGISHE